MENLNPKPSVGRVVHFRDEEGCLAAIITNVRTDDDDVDLFVMSPSDYWNESDVTLGDTHGTWHWPERV